MDPCANYSLAVALRTVCPAARWHDTISDLLLRPHMVLLNVGANKGYNVAEFVQRYGSGTGGGPTSNKQWYKALKSGPQRVRFGCGMCMVCDSPPLTVRHSAPAVTSYAVEMMPSNVKALR